MALEIEEILKAFKNCKGFKLNLSNVNFIHVEWALNVVTSLFWLGLSRFLGNPWDGTSDA